MASRSKKHIDLSPKLRKLLIRVIDCYHTTFAEDPRAVRYLQKRGISDKSLSDTYQIGFANGTLLDVLPPGGDIIDQLKTIGILSDDGKERLCGSLIFPLYDLKGDPINISGHRIDGIAPADQPEQFFLPDSNSGLFNRQAARSHKDIILTGSVMDSLPPP